MNKQIGRWILSWLLAWTTSVLADDYRMVDLEALADQQQWVELWTHIGDVRPADRTEAWQVLLHQAVQGRADQLQVANEPYAALSFVKKAVEQHPGLKSNNKFMAQRAKIGWKAFSDCVIHPYLAPDACRRLFLGFVRQAPSSNLAFKGGQLVRKNVQHYELAIPFFHLALAKHQDSPNCYKEDVWLAINAALDLPESAREEIPLAQELAFGACWEAVREQLIRSAARSTLRLHRTCDSLLEKKALTGLRLKKCNRLQTRKSE